jgi:putative membrane protein
MEQLFADIHLSQVVSTVFYGVLGLMLFLLSFWVLEKLTKFSIRDEIIEDQNISLGVIIAGYFIGIAIILSAVLR